jgi:hypothetical protein
VQRAEVSQMIEEGCLREHARVAIRNGKLPNLRPERTWGGPGGGAPCSVCNQPVTRSEMEFEVEFAHNGANPGLDKFHVHIRCFAAWELERTQER